MNFTAMALVFRDDATITSILRENNRFNDTLARIEQDAPSEEREIIGRVRSAQDEVLIIVADIANLVRDGKIEQAMKLQLGHSSIQVTVDRYGHFIPGANRQAVDRLAEATAPASMPWNFDSSSTSENRAESTRAESGASA